MCFARSRPPITLLVYSIHAVLSSYTGVQPLRRNLAVCSLLPSIQSRLGLQHACIAYRTPCFQSIPGSPDCFQSLPYSIWMLYGFMGAARVRFVRPCPLFRASGESGLGLQRDETIYCIRNAHYATLRPCAAGTDSDRPQDRRTKQHDLIQSHFFYISDDSALHNS